MYVGVNRPERAMRIITERRITEYGQSYADARKPLAAWVKAVKLAAWGSLADVQKVFASADGVKVGSGRSVIIFDLRGNKYRLITAIHFNTGSVYVLRFLTHAEYSKDHWKKEL